MPIIPSKSQSSSYSLPGYNDSISKFDSSKDIYSTRATPLQQKRANQVNPNRRIDSIETPTEKNDRITPIKVSPNNMGTSGDQAIKIARAGRFIFFAIAGPPFFLLFSLPKFAFRLVIPFMMQQMQRIVFQIQKLFTPLNQMVKKYLMNPIRNILGNLLLKTGKIEKLFSSLLAYISLPLKPLKTFINVTIKEKIKTAARPIIRLLKVIKEKTSSLAKESTKILSKSLKLLSNTWDNIVQPMMTWFKPQITKILNVYSRTTNLIKKIANKPIFKKVSQAISQVFVKLQQFIPQMAQIVQPMINILIPTIQLFKRTVEKGVKWIKDKPKRQFQNLMAKGKKIYSAFAPILNQTYDTLMKWGKRYFWKAIQLLFTFLLWIFKKLVDIIVWVHPSFEKKVEQAKKINLYTKSKLQNLVLMTKKKFQQFGNYIHSHMKRMVDTPKDYFMSLLKKCFVIVSKVFKFFALILIAVCLVIKYWFEMLFELSDYMGEKLTKSNVKS